MAVTIDVGRLRRYLAAPKSGAWLPGGDNESDLQQMLDWAKQELERWAPDAPATAHNEACLRLCGYAIQKGGFWAGPGNEPMILPGTGGPYLLHSGAAAILSHWHPIAADPVE